MNESQSFGLFDTVVGGPAAVPYAVGWALLITGTLWSLLGSMLKNISGQKNDPLAVWLNSAVLAAGLSLYAFITKAVWWGTQSIAQAIFPDDRMQALGKALKTIAQHQRVSSGSNILDVGQKLKDGLVEMSGLASWALAMLSHWSIQQTQRGVFNVVFIFGPLLIGLAAWGLPTARVWLMALFEVSSWSISAAALYFGLQTYFDRYMGELQSTSVLDGSWLDTISGLFFLSMMMAIVPIITGRLLGAATLGELSRISGGSSMADSMASGLRNRMASASAAPDPASGTSASRPAQPPRQGRGSDSSHRPGD